MKKILLALLALTVVANAEVILGTDLFYGDVDSELTASAGGNSASADEGTKVVGMMFKAGYQWESVRLLGTIASEKYKDDMVVENEGNLVSYGAELDYILPFEDGLDLYVGVIVATGEKDFNSADVDFTDVGVKAGGLVEVSETLELEIGVKYVNRDYDSYEYQGVTLDLEDKIIGVYVGVNFSL